MELSHYRTIHPSLSISFHRPLLRHNRTPVKHVSNRCGRVCPTKPSHTNIKLISIFNSAGVSGLTTALLLARNGYNVSVVAKHMPGDYDIEYCSPWAGADYSPFALTLLLDKEGRSNHLPVVSLPLNSCISAGPQHPVMQRWKPSANAQQNWSTTPGQSWNAWLVKSRPRVCISKVPSLPPRPQIKSPFHED